MAAQRHARSRGAPSSDRGMRERDRDRDRERERDRERDRDRDRERERERSGFFSERERGARGIGDGYKDKDKDLHVKERERERDRSRDRDRVREREREQGGRGVRRHPEAEGERRQSPSRGVVLGTAAQAMSAVIASPGSETASERAPQSVASQSAGKQGSKDTEREPGELSSGSRNEDGDRNQMDFVESKDRAVQGEEGSGRAAEAAPSPASGARSVMSKQPHSRGREAVGGGGSAGAPASGDTVNPVPAKKRKFSPIVWDLDDKSGARSRLSSASAAASSIARFGASQEASSQRASSQRLVPNSSTPSSHAPTTPASTSGAGLGPSQSASFASQTGRQSPPLPGRRTPPQSARSTPSFPSHHTPPLPGHHRSPSVTLSGERQTPTLSSGTPTGRVPAVTERDVGTSVSPLPPVAYSQGGNSPGTSLGDKEALDMPQAEPDNNVSTSPLESDDMPGQLPTAGSPSRMDEDDDGIVPPPITIAASRWAEETHTPEHVKSPQMVALKSRMAQPSSSLDSEDGRVSSDRDQGREASRGHSTSPEPGEYIREKPEDGRGAKGKGSESDGSVGHGSVGRESRENCDEEDEKELNKRELMELDAEGDVDEPEEQIPELDSESDDEAQQAPIGVAQRTIDMLKGCRSVDEFERLNKIDEGTYGVVYRARDRRTGEIVALKKVKMEKETEGFPMTSLREINVLLSFHHPSVVDVKEVVVGSNLDSIFMVMEYMEHDLKGLMENMKQPFSQSEVKCLMLQLFEGVKYLHDNWVLHRDLKTSNLLLNNRGELKICDFGLARQYGSPLKAYTHMVVTLWYRAPELLLGSKLYSTAIDMWSLGCIMAEFLAKKPLFNGETEIDQLDKIFKILGTPTETIWPDYAKLPSVKCNFVRQPYNRLREKFPPTSFVGRPALSESGFDLLNKLLTYDPLKRITAEEALKHSWFTEVPLPKAKEFMPTFPVRSEHERSCRRLRRLMRSPDPLEEQRKRDLRQAELLFGVSG